MKYNLAIIGYGGMGSWHHGCIREKISELNVKGAYDIRPEIQQKIIQNGLNAYQNIEELLNDSSIDIVTIAVPNNFHKTMRLLASKPEKTSCVEKPVTMNAAELEEIIAISKQTGKAFHGSSKSSLGQGLSNCQKYFGQRRNRHPVFYRNESTRLSRGYVRMARISGKRRRNVVGLGRSPIRPTARFNSF